MSTLIDDVGGTDSERDAMNAEIAAGIPEKLGANLHQPMTVEAIGECIAKLPPVSLWRSEVGHFPEIISPESEAPQFAKKDLSEPRYLIKLRDGMYRLNPDGTETKVTDWATHPDESRENLIKRIRKYVAQNVTWQTQSWEAGFRTQYVGFLTFQKAIEFNERDEITEPSPLAWESKVREKIISQIADELMALLTPSQTETPRSGD